MSGGRRGRKKRGRGDAFGVVLVDKPEGPTSHDVVGWVRWALGERQVGHCGTLDPAASGLLVICVGAATRFVPYLTGVEKTYRARFVLGVATDSADREGQETARVDPDIARAATGRARAALLGMVGDLQLPPPIFSAVKQDGERAHRRARRGEDVELPPRDMTVIEIRDIVVSEDDPWVDATVCVSKGTYIRSLAVELGRRLGVPAHLGALRRTGCGQLALADAGGALPTVRLSAERLPDTRDEAARGRGGPRWRCRPRDSSAHSSRDGASVSAEQARESARDVVAAALGEPSAYIPLPVVSGDDDAGRVAISSLLARFVHGQDAWLPQEDAERLGMRVASSGAEGLVCVCGAPEGDSATRLHVITAISVEPGEQPGLRLRPKRVIRGAVRSGEKGGAP